MSELKKGRSHPNNLYNHLVHLDVLNFKVLKGGLKK